mmetsp:Transcript_2383/g.6400  ORF Transcript_2383/g.6400 Transcript_2383/m.6400 type:complete len:296 (-) Transcript_2383:11-898(-)
MPSHGLGIAGSHKDDGRSDDDDDDDDENHPRRHFRPRPIDGRGGLPEICPNDSRILATVAALALALALGDYSIELERPLGMILEEREDGGSSGVRVQSVVKDAETAGSAWKTGRIAPGDVLLAIDGVDVSSSDFETVMELLTTTTATTTTLVLGDGLGRFDMPPNVLKRLETPEDAMMIDAVVREAVRKIRRDGRLGDVLRVEVIVGAGVSQQQKTTTTTTQKRGMVRFFAIFSTDGVSTYSCNVSATGVETDENDEKDISSNAIRIVSLSCAKDEGLGRTYDLIQEEEETSKAQ